MSQSDSRKSQRTFIQKMKRHIPKTLESTYHVKVRDGGGKEKTIKADRDRLRRLLVASQGGREIDMKSILEHELSPVPLSLASTNFKLNKGNKAYLATLLIEDVDVKSEIAKSDKKSFVVIDGPALIQQTGKPDGAKIFGDLADTFVTKVLNNYSATCCRVDVLFDRYNDLSIKSGTREQRTGSIRPIRRRIDNREVKLPQNWKQYISLSANKENLASFLSNELRAQSGRVPTNGELVIAGGFENVMETFTTSERDISHLRANHEEADTRIPLHAKDALEQGFEKIIINCKDTDVLVMATELLPGSTSEIWMRAGTLKNTKNIPVHLIDIPSEVKQNLMLFHALTGCDSTSQFSGKVKRVPGRSSCNTHLCFVAWESTNFLK